jgi:hypothetical protein
MGENLRDQEENQVYKFPHFQQMKKRQVSEAV